RVAVDSDALDAGDFFVLDDCVAILDNRDRPTDQGDVEGLPFSRLSRQLRRRGQETINAAHVMARGLVALRRFDLNFVTAAEIDTTVGIHTTIELDVQLEILELGIVDQVGPVARCNQRTILDFPDRWRVRLVHSPSSEILSVKELYRLFPCWRSKPFQY